MGDPHPPPNPPKPPDFSFKPPDSHHKSYASVLSNQNTSFGDENTQEKVLDKSFFDGPAMEKMGQISFYQARRTIRFSDDEIDVISSPFRFTLIGKFSHGYPTMQTLRLKMAGLGLKGDFTIGVLNIKHILIRLKLEEDYTRLWMRQIIFIDGFPMRVFKWTPTFDPKEESPLVPVWIRFPNLPVQFFNKIALFNIASMIGTPLRIDESTAKLTRPSIARVCVEVDLTKPLEHEITIGFYSLLRIQRIEYERLPKYCNRCKHLGHGEKECYDGQIHGDRKGTNKVTQSSKEDTIGLQTNSNNNVNGRFAAAPQEDLRRQLNRLRGLEAHDGIAHAGEHSTAHAAAVIGMHADSAGTCAAAGTNAAAGTSHPQVHAPQDLVHSVHASDAHHAPANGEKSAQADVRADQDSAAHGAHADGKRIAAAALDIHAVAHTAFHASQDFVHVPNEVVHALDPPHAAGVAPHAAANVQNSAHVGAHTPDLTVHPAVPHAIANVSAAPRPPPAGHDPFHVSSTNAPAVHVPLHVSSAIQHVVHANVDAPSATAAPPSLEQQIPSSLIGKHVNVGLDDVLDCPLNTQGQDFNFSSTSEAEISPQSIAHKVFDGMSEPKQPTPQVFDEMPQRKDKPNSTTSQVLDEMPQPIFTSSPRTAHAQPMPVVPNMPVVPIMPNCRVFDEMPQRNLPPNHTAVVPTLPAPLVFDEMSMRNPPISKVLDKMSTSKSRLPSVFYDSIEDVRALALHRCHSSDELGIPKPPAPRRSKRLALKRLAIRYSSDSEYYEEEEFDRLFGHEYEQYFDDDFIVN